MIISPRYLQLFKRLSFLLVVYSFIRLGFYFYHHKLFSSFSASDLFYSFFLGLRFDIAAVCLVNAPIVILTSISLINERFLRILFITLNSIGFIISINDYELFLFLGKRLAFDFFVIADDIWTQLPQVTLYYWYLPLMAIMGSIAFYFFDRNFFSFEEKKTDWKRHVFESFLIFALTFIGIRGGLQGKSINVQSAFVQGKNELGHLVLNTPYHFIRTLNSNRIERIKFFESDSEAKKIILSLRDFSQDFPGVDRANVVLIILESFSMEYIENGYAPFLSELMKKSLSFEKGMANGRRSIEALPSILCGVPALLNEPLSKSSFSGNKFHCFPKSLKKNGYTNYFFHGGSKGTMGFDSFTLANGFDRYFAKEEYPNPNDFDGNWGIFDGPYLQYVAQNISQMPEPFLAGIFTLSSHHPYTVPSEFENKFPKGQLEIHPAIGYADFALKEFFKKIEDESWYKNTLFVITADHTHKLSSKKYENMIGRYRVPLIFYFPGFQWALNDQKVVQHADIPKSILDFVGIEDKELNGMGASVFSHDKGLAINSADEVYFSIQDSTIITLAKDKTKNKLEYNWKTGELKSIGASEDKLLPAYVQYFINGLLSNNLSLWR
ncbi:MAG: LTA synthase family protein [Bacteriovoracaceae bacterium]